MAFGASFVTFGGPLGRLWGRHWVSFVAFEGPVGLHLSPLGLHLGSIEAPLGVIGSHFDCHFSIIFEISHFLKMLRQS